MAFILVQTSEGLLEEAIIFEPGTSCVVSETMRGSALVTEHPIEEGANLADHIRPNNPSVGLEVIISNTPTRRDINEDNGSFELISLVGLPERPQPPIGTPGSATRFLTGEKPVSPVQLIALQFEEFDPRVDILNALESIRTDSKLSQVYTSIRRYESMSLLSLDASRSVGDGNGLRISMEFSQIRKATLEVVAAPPQPAEPRGAPTVAAGNEYAADPELRQWLAKQEVAETDRRTLAKKLLDGLGKYL
jgi:hypothetical protein